MDQRFPDSTGDIKPSTFIAPVLPDGVRLAVEPLLSVLLGEVPADHATPDCTDDGMVAMRSVR